MAAVRGMHGTNGNWAIPDYQMGDTKEPSGKINAVEQFESLGVPKHTIDGGCNRRICR